jgi:serine/threonine protein phosphatase PrpC
MELFYSGLSDIGNVRQNNEDYYFAGKLRDNEYLFIMADGMGGHKAGEVASRKAVSIFVRELEKGTGDNISKGLKRIIHSVNETLFQEGSRTAVKGGMGTTLSVFYVKEDRGYIAHVGDSRIYRFFDSGTDTTHALEQLTEDHSFVGKLLKNGFITEEEARNHPRRNVLYQSIGLKQDINVQVVPPIPIQRGRKYLLCTDGLYGVVPESEIAESLKEKSTAAVARRLVQKAKALGGPDNISVIVIFTEYDEQIGINDITFVEDTETTIVSSSEKRKRRKRPIYILLGLLVLLLAVIIYLLIVSAGSNGDNTPALRKETPAGIQEKTREK